MVCLKLTGFKEILLDLKLNIKGSRILKIPSLKGIYSVLEPSRSLWLTSYTRFQKLQKPIKGETRKWSWQSINTLQNSVWDNAVLFRKPAVMKAGFYVAMMITHQSSVVPSHTTHYSFLYYQGHSFSKALLRVTPPTYNNRCHKTNQHPCQL